MRTIKFRAWDTTAKAMILDYKIGFLEGTYSYSINDEFTNEEYVFMQYTGLKDQNGKEIYEGDIVRTKGMGGGVSGVVEYDSDRAKFVLNMFDVAGSVDKFDDRDLDYGDLDWEYYKILGNIHENPELLKK